MSALECRLMLQLLKYKFVVDYQFINKIEISFVV